MQTVYLSLPLLHLQSRRLSWFLRLITRLHFAGLGLNAYFAYTVCLGELKDVANPFTICLTAVFVEGIIFIIISAFKFREQIINGIPQNLEIWYFLQESVCLLHLLDCREQGLLQRMMLHWLDWGISALQLLCCALLVF